MAERIRQRTHNSFKVGSTPTTPIRPYSYTSMVELKIGGQIVLVDEDCYQKVSRYSWWISKDGKSPGYITVRGKVEGKTVFLHRFLLGLQTGDKKVVDHINRNTLDNRKCNLRITTQSVNRLNSRKPQNKTGYMGVTKEYNYIAGLCGSRLGSFRTAKEAALYRDKVALEKYGENVEFNFPLDFIKKSECPTPLSRGESLRGKEFVEKRIYERPNKVDLHKWVWNESIVSISEKMGCSDNTIRKWCKRYKISTPNRGFWSKVQASKLEGQFCPLP